MVDRLRSRFGRGPKNYRRADERIREDICEALVDQPWIDASDVEVQVDNAEVTLTGTAPDRRYKREIEDVAHGIRGVRDVHNRIRVQRDDERANNAPNDAPNDEQRRPTNPRA
jgi:osmotically-inducible protein OsmY